MTEETLNLLLSGIMGILGGLSLIVPNMFVTRMLKRDELLIQHKYNSIEKRNELKLQHDLSMEAKKLEMELQNEINEINEMNGNLLGEAIKELISSLAGLETRVAEIESRLIKLQNRHDNE